MSINASIRNDKADKDLQVLNFIDSKKAITYQRGYMTYMDPLCF